jgi:hypothetical protein
MSKFIERLNRISQGMPQPIGFRRAEAAAERPRIQLVAHIIRGDIDSLADFVAGADAALVPLSKSTSSVETLKKISGAMAKVPWGGWLGDIDQKKLKQVISHGCDFIVFPAATTPLAVPQNEELGKIIQVEASLDVSLLRALNEVSVDAVLITIEDKERDALTWHHLMLFHRFASLLNKPLLVPVPPAVTASELQSLWEAGVDGIVVEAGAGHPADAVQKVRQTINGLTFPVPRRPEKREAILPRMEKASDTVAEPEEEEEE